MSPVDDPATTLQLLGPVGAERAGEPLRVGGPRQRALLATLAIRRGRWVSTDALVEEVFQGEPTEAAETTLRSYVSKLRAALGQDVRISGGASGYMLETAPAAIDMVRFETLIAEGGEALRGRRPAVAADRLRTALALWRGEPFGGLAVDGLLRVEAERLEELRLHALESRIEADLSLGEAAALVDELELLVRQHPFRETFWRQLMLALYRSERQADALAAYHRARAALDEQLGIEPGEELAALEAAILRHEVPEVTPPARRDNLPAAVTSFVGRELELSRVEALLGANRLVTLTGVGGVGKTRLAIEAARGLAPSFADGLAFVDLAPLADASLVAEQVAAVLEIAGNTNVDVLDRLVTHLRDRELLLLLDNCEHLLAACAGMAARLLVTCPSLRILATSREVLGVDGEADSPVPPLAIPAAGEPGVRTSEAVQLFVARARAARPSLPDDDLTVATIRNICADLEGIPLAIELAAARARVLSPTEINERLRDRFQFLVSWRRLSTARHRTLREAMDWSYDLLEPSGQRLLAELSVFAGGFGLEAIAAVCSIGSSPGVLDQVQRLVEASLVSVDQSGGQTRYGLLETVRQYGNERLEGSGAGDTVRRRHARHFAEVADEAWFSMRIPETHEAVLARLRADRDNFRAALGWSLDNGEPGLALQITGTMWRSWWLSGEGAEGRTWLVRALAADDRSDLRLRLRPLIGLAGVLWSFGETDAAAAPAEEARELAEQVGDAAAGANAYNTLGLIAQGRGEIALARTLFAESVARNRKADLPPDFRAWNLAIAIDNLGSVAFELGDHRDAMRQYVDARAINEQLGSREGVAMGDLHIALVDVAVGRHDDARPRLHDALLVYEDIGFLHYTSECFEVAAAIADLTTSWDEAAFSLGAAAGIHRQLANEAVPIMARVRDSAAAAARSALGDQAFEAAYAQGLAAPVADAIRRTIEFLKA